MSKNLFFEWHRKFRKDTAADKLVLFKEHLTRLELKDRLEDLLEGTMQAVYAGCDYEKIDEPPVHVGKKHGRGA